MALATYEISAGVTLLLSRYSLQPGDVVEVDADIVAALPEASSSRFTPSGAAPSRTLRLDPARFGVAQSDAPAGGSSDPFESAPALVAEDWEDLNSIDGTGDALVSKVQAGDGVIFEASPASSDLHTIRLADSLPAGDIQIAARIAFYVDGDPISSSFNSGMIGLNAGIGIAPGGMADPTNVDADWVELEAGSTPSSNGVRTRSASSMASAGSQGIFHSNVGVQAIDFVLDRIGTKMHVYFMRDGQRVRIGERTVAAGAGDVFIRMNTKTPSVAGKRLHLQALRVGGMAWQGAKLVLV